MTKNACATLIETAMLDLAAAVDALPFSPPAVCVYNPLDYAREPALAYIRKYARPCRAVLVGMNPGPFGMAQTGVPFGEIASVRDWLGIAGHVGHPTPEHPKRPISGFACTRSEVSGRRLWSFFRALYPTPADFFRTFFVANYCPLVFMEESGRNLTPDKLPAAERIALYAACDRHLAAIVRATTPEFVIGVGAFATKRAREALGEVANLEFATLPHPSPASPLANRGWDDLARSALMPLGLLPGS